MKTASQKAKKVDFGKIANFTTQKITPRVVLLPRSILILANITPITSRNPPPLPGNPPLVSDAQNFLAAFGGQEKFTILDLPNHDFTRENAQIWGPKPQKKIWPPPAARKKSIFWTPKIAISRREMTKSELQLGPIWIF